jgi:hypothetical protein
MMINKRLFQLTLGLLMGVLALAMPVTVSAQEIFPPPEWQGDGEVSENDILVFEPQLFFELPFAQGFRISFNFGFSLQVPRQLTFLTNEAYDLLLRFRSYIIPAQ